MSQELYSPVPFVTQPRDHVIFVTRPSPCRNCSERWRPTNISLHFNVIDVSRVLHSPLMTPPLEKTQLTVAVCVLRFFVITKVSH